MEIRNSPANTVPAVLGHSLYRLNMTNCLGKTTDYSLGAFVAVSVHKQKKYPPRGLVLKI